MSCDNKKYSHKVNEYVTYGQNGICQIIDIQKQKIKGIERTYYIMKSVYNNTKIMVPVDSDMLVGNMRHILSEKEILDIIKKSEDSDNIWMQDTKLRSEQLEKMLHNGDRADILWIVKMLSMYKLQAEKEGKRFYASDERILYTAEKIITEEFAFALGIERNEVIPYITAHINN